MKLGPFKDDLENQNIIRMWNMVLFFFVIKNDFHNLHGKFRKRGSEMCVRPAYMNNQELYVKVFFLWMKRIKMIKIIALYR